MLKKALSLIFLPALLLLPAQAQKKNNPGWPGVAFVKAKIFLYNLDNQLYGQYHAWKNGQANFTLAGKGTTLDADQVQRLQAILSSDTRVLSEGLSKCYEPHHAVFFYDARDHIVAAFDICFLCEGIRLYPGKTGEKPIKRYSEPMTQKAQEQLAQIKAIFEELQVPVFDTREAVSQYARHFERTDTLEVRSDSLLHNLVKTFETKEQILNAAGDPSLKLDSIFSDNQTAIPVSYFNGKTTSTLLSVRCAAFCMLTHLETTARTGFFNARLNVGTTRTEVNRLIFPATKQYAYHNVIAIRDRQGKSVLFIHFNEDKAVDHLTYTHY